MKFLGLHLEKNSLTTALVVKDKKRFKVNFVEIVLLNEDGPREVKELLEKISLKEKTLFTVSALETHSILLRSLEMPLKSPRDLLKTLPFQLENIIPYPLEEVIVIPSVEKKTSATTKDRSNLTLFCCHNKIYEEHFEILKNYGIDPQWVGCVPQALYRFARYYTEEKDLIIVHMANDATHIIAVLEDKPRYSFQIEIGKQSFLEALQQDRPDFENKEIEALFYQMDCFSEQRKQYQYFSILIDRFLKEIDRIFYFLLHKKEGRNLDKIFFLKEENFLFPFKNYIEQSMDLVLEIAELKDQENKKLKPYAVPIGLGIDVLSDDHKTLQFRKVADTQKNVSKYILKNIKIYALCSIITCIAAIISSNLLLKHKENILNKKLTTLMERYPEEVADLQRKVENQPFFSRLNSIEKHFNKIKKPYGYYLTPTHVGDFLEYLLKEEKNFPTCKINQLDYELVQYPTLDQPLDPYKIKVELKINAEKDEIAQGFFEKIINNTVWIEESPTPLLTKENDGYQTTVILKTFK